MARKKTRRKKKGFPWLIVVGGLGLATAVGFGVAYAMKPKARAVNGVPTGQGALAGGQAGVDAASQADPRLAAIQTG